MPQNEPTQAAQQADTARWLDSQVAPLDRQLAAAARAESRWSVARLLTFLLAALIWLPLQHAPLLAVLAVVIGISLFVASIRRHRRAFDLHTFLKRRRLVVDESLQRAGGRVVTIRSTARPGEAPAAKKGLGHLWPSGQTWPITDQERDDLDLYATPTGLFGLLNRTSTEIGATRLRDMLENPLLETDPILRRQQAVRWLAEHHDPRTRLLAALAGLRDLGRQMPIFEEAVAVARPVLPAIASWLLRAWSLGVLVFALYAASRVLEEDYAPATWLGLLMSVNVLLWLPLWSRVRQALLRYQRSAEFAREYCNVADQAAADLPGQPHPDGSAEDRERRLRVPHSSPAGTIAGRSCLRATLESGEATVSGRLGEPVAGLEGADAPSPYCLARLRDLFLAIRRRGALPSALPWIAWSAEGGFLQVLLDLLLFYDVHVLEGIQRHILPHREPLLQALAATAELEAFLSLGCFAAEQPTVCWPSRAEPMHLSIRGGVHPLIDPAAAVPNDVSLSAQPNVWIITGSNMSGKSTFLRMIGVNVLLAQTAGVALAREMTFSPLRLVSDLRIRDNLGKGESYFLAEVRHLRRMIVPPPGDVPMLGLIDEPFRGTNHREQRAATLAIIEHLVRAKGMFLVATHDSTVTRLADGICAQNRHFQEQLGETELVFDYRLQPGPAVTRNAIRVLQREQYPADLVERALRHADAQQPDDPDRPVNPSA